MSKYTFLERGGYFGRHGLLFGGICGKLFLRVELWGKSDSDYAGFERYQGVNGVVVGDGELILWGMEAMP